MQKSKLIDLMIEDKISEEDYNEKVEKSKNGIFVELRPNLVGLADYKEGIEYGEHINVYIKKIIPDKKKVKLIII